MGDVVNFTGTTVLDIPPNNVLKGAMDELVNVLVIGERKDGSLYRASSTELAWDLYMCKLFETTSMLEVIATDDPDDPDYA